MLINAMSSVILAASMATSAVPFTARPASVPTPSSIQISVEKVAREAAARDFAVQDYRQAAGLPRVATTRAPRRSVGKIIAGVLIGGTIGFFAGGYTGVAIENKFNPCHCDDPGLMGAIIGAPIGAVVGAVAGGLIAR